MADRVSAFWWRYEIPTVFVILAMYTAWFLAVWYHARLPWWALLGIGGYATALHSSLQHESIHALRAWPRWLRWAAVYPPLGLWTPYPVYLRVHSKHHYNPDLTYPGIDPESHYMTQARWREIGRVGRGLFLANQTLGFHLLFVPLISWPRFWCAEFSALARGNRAHLSAWLWHIPMTGLIFAFVVGVAGMSWWQYVLFFAYPHICLISLRSYYEHRWAEKPKARIAAVEAEFPLAFLFLWNNLHIVHHVKASLPWYEIPGFWRAHRAKLLQHNGHYLFAGGYLELARKFFFRPVFVPAHPTR